ncbi:MAG: DUF2834 domain-containing protein [Gammaproteobacteria bacterium]|nr:DUF2834 domain-containing protein [Gammaproteobacteria bacterium]
MAIMGAIVPYVFFIDFFITEGFGLVPFIAAVFTNGAAGGATADLLISSVVFWGWLVHVGARRIWVFVLLNVLIGLSCALPAYLYSREVS